MALKGFTPEVEAAFKEALALTEKQGELPQLFPVLRGLSTYYQFRMEFDKSFELGERILALAESKDDDLMRIHAYLLIGSNVGLISGLDQELAWLEQGIALFDPDRQRLQPFQVGNNPGIVCYTASAIYLWWQGFANQAFARAQKAFDIATRLEHPYTMAYACFHTGVLYLWSGEMQQARSRAITMREIAAEQEYHLWYAMATILLGAAESGLGAAEAGLARLEEGFAAYMGHISPPVFWPMITTIRAAAHGRAGKAAEGLNMLDDLLQDGQQLPDILILKGELLLQESPSNTAAATKLFREGLELAQMMGYKIFVLRAVSRLAELEVEEGKAGENGRLLADLYDSFTEGFETRDLQEARSVLERRRELTD
ncbi:MAG: hypothetical protein ACK2T4_04985 [Candidatus Promineifilaceae bacterium]|jgi:tetratricopeptide (TPR) repeat protein